MKVKSSEYSSAPEYVDWLDKKGNIIGQIDKSFAHLHGLLHVAVHVFVLDAKKRLILQFRSHKKKIYPLNWDTSVGGHVHAGEDLLKSTQREAWEELGIKTKLHYLGHTDVNSREKNTKGSFHHHERVHFYVTHLPKGVKIRPNEEFDDIAFIPPAEISVFMRNKKFTDIFIAGWKKFGKMVKKEGEMKE